MATKLQWITHASCLIIKDEYFLLTDRNESNINTAVKKRSNKDIPDMPKVKLIPYDFIQSIVCIFTNEPFD